MIPDHAVVIADAVKPLGAMVVASPGTIHVTVVHEPEQASLVDEAIVANGLRGERISLTKVKVFAL